MHRKGHEHDVRLESLLERLEENGITLRREKCEWGQQETCWFGMIYNRQGMSINPKRIKAVREWQRPKDRRAVKSFLQNAQFCMPFMRQGERRTYSDVTWPLRQLTLKKTRLQWTKECNELFKEIKQLLCSDKVLANWEPWRETRPYMDDGPAGVASNQTQA